MTTCQSLNLISTVILPEPSYRKCYLIELRLPVIFQINSCARSLFLLISTLIKHPVNKKFTWKNDPESTLIKYIFKNFA